MIFAHHLLGRIPHCPFAITLRLILGIDVGLDHTTGRT
jgi:hypothetical protein